MSNPESVTSYMLSVLKVVDPEMDPSDLLTKAIMEHVRPMIPDDEEFYTRIGAAAAEAFDV